MYHCRTERMPTSRGHGNWRNYRKAFNYDRDLFIRHPNESIDELICQIAYTYNTLVLFNNNLFINRNYAFSLIHDFLSTHSDIKKCPDSKCRDLYKKFDYWDNLYQSNPTEETYQRICNEIQQILSFLCKKGFVKESGCNLKKNYY